MWITLSLPSLSGTLWLFVLPLLKSPLSALQESLSTLLWGGGRSQLSVDRSAVNVLKIGAWECPIWRAIGSLKGWLSWVNLEVWKPKVKKASPRLNSSLKAESPRRSRGEAPYFNECHKTLHRLHRSSDLLRSRK